MQNKIPQTSDALNELKKSAETLGEYEHLT
jgi:hypothetical protein